VSLKKQKAEGETKKKQQKNDHKHNKGEI